MYDNILYLKDSKYFTRKFLDLMNIFSKIRIQKSESFFLYANNEHVEKEVRKTIPFVINKLIKYLNECNPGGERGIQLKH